MTPETQAAGWIGPRPSNLEIFAVMFVGVAGIMIAGLQPLLLGTLSHEGKITANQLGLAATAELLALGLAAFFAGAVLKPVRLKLIAVVMALILAALDAATPLVEGDNITLIRGLAGLPSGVLMWVTIAMIARTPAPERWSGAYLTIQTLAQFLLATLISVAVVATWGASGGWIALAGFCVVTAIVAFFVPDRLAPLVRDEGASSLPGPRGWIALLSAFLYSAFTIAVWVYAEPLSKQAGHDSSIFGYAVSISLAWMSKASALASKPRPVELRYSDLPTRSNKGRSNMRSSSTRALLAADCDSFSCAAARDTFSVRAMATKYSKLISRSSIAGPRST